MFLYISNNSQEDSIESYSSIMLIISIVEKIE